MASIGNTNGAVVAELKCSHCAQEVQPGEPSKRVSVQVEGVAGDAHRLYHETCFRRLEAEAAPLAGRVSLGEAVSPRPLWPQPMHPVAERMVRLSLAQGQASYRLAIAQLPVKELNELFAHLPYERSAVMINLQPILERIDEVSSQHLGIALRVAAEKGNPILIDHIAAHKARLTDPQFTEALISACRFGKVEVIRQLKRHGMISEWGKQFALRRFLSDHWNINLLGQKPNPAEAEIIELLQPRSCSIQ